MEGHQRGTSVRTAHDPRRPSLERPSLFAGPDDDSADTDGLRSVRILSTLESQERGKGAPSRRTAQPRASGRTTRSDGAPAFHRPGTQGLLWALVVAGLASAGAALWWAMPTGSDAPEPATALVATGATAPKHSPPHAAKPASAAWPETASTPQGTPLAALIENTPPAAGPSVLTIAPVGSAASSPADAHLASRNTPARKARSEQAPASRQPKAVDKPSTNKRGEARPAPRKEKRETAKSDRDVELLEAVMTHTERRQRP